MPRTQLVFHIGLHKTATSFLQRRVFPLLEGITYAGYPPPDGQTIRRAISIVRPDLPLLVSDEGLSGHPFRGRWIEEFEENVRGLATLFPEARIVVGFRAHRAWLVSVYKQYLNKGGTRSLRTFLGLEGERGILRERDTRFAPRLDLLEAYFPGGVFVYTQEEIAGAFGPFLADLCAFLGSPCPAPEAIDFSRENVGVGGRQARLLRRLNALDLVLKKAVVLPTLNNRIFRRLSLDPRGLCQRRLARLGGGQPLEFPEEAADWAAAWAADWDRVLEARRARTRLLPSNAAS